LTPLETLIRERAARAGSLSLAEVMRLALYHPSLGYYSRLRGFGAEGDFTTSPEVSPVFGQLLARQACDVWQFLGEPKPFRVLELGAGSGALAFELLRHLPFAHYAIEELSPSLRQVQQDRLLGLPATWDSREQPHLVIANEVLDAQPVHRLTVRGGILRELRVGRNFEWVETEAPAEAHAYFKRLGLLPPEGTVTEVNLGLGEWVKQLAARLGRGMALILDYGYTAETLFSRPMGTLLTYYRHTLGSDPLVRLGEQDISVHVDFTTLATAAHQAGLQVLGVISQATFLRNLGPIDGPGADHREVWPLIDPRGLGRIGVLFLGCGLDDYVPLGVRSPGALTV
jgi:SAM-dependent MidA family methyltransferase